MWSVLRLAERAVAVGPSHPFIGWFQFAHGLAQYRQGRYEEALAAVESAPRISPNFQDEALSAQSLIVSAMCRQQLKQSEAAAKDLAAGKQLVEAAFAKLETPAGLGPAWHDWLFAQALLEEAELLEGKASPPQP